MADGGTLDPDEVEPLVAAYRAAAGEGRSVLEDALARLPVASGELRAVGIDPAARMPLRPAWAEGEPPGFTWYPASARRELDARVAALGPPWVNGPQADEGIAPALVTGWFAQTADANFALGDRAVRWVSAYDRVFRPDLEGLHAEYRRAALAEGTRPLGVWFLPDWDPYIPGFRLLCRQIAWTVSRGGLRGLVPGLAGPLGDDDETERTIAALLIAEAAECLADARPPVGPTAAAPPVGAAAPPLRAMLSDAARAGFVPASGRVASDAPVAVRPGRPVAAAEPTPLVPPPAPRPAPTADAPRPRGRSAAVGFGLVVLGLGGLAIAKWLLGWFVPVTEAGAPPEPEPDHVQCTVFAPPAASPGSTILVQVFAHLPEEADDARAIATELDVAARRRAFRTLAAPVPDGARLDFELRLPGLEVDDPVASLTWRGSTEAVQFGVDVAPDAAAGTVIGTVSIGRDGLPLGHVKFALAIDAAASPSQPEPQGEDARRYRVAFVSYSSRDRDEVLRRVQMLHVAGLRTFQDVLDLEPGEVWSERIEQAIREADVFLLFWSSRAKGSEWVRREVDFALACRRGDELSPPEIRPVIIEGPPVVPPWDDLAHLHFDDRVLYFMSRPG